MCSSECQKERKKQKKLEWDNKNKDNIIKSKLKTYKNNNCLFCNANFVKKNKKQIFCSSDCRLKYWRINKKDKKPIFQKKCNVCGLMFTPKNNSQKYCSDICSKENQKFLHKKYREENKIKYKKCISCGALFRIKSINQKYCTSTCRINTYKKKSKIYYSKPSVRKRRLEYAKEYGKEWYIKNKESKNLKNKEWYVNNRDKVNKYRRDRTKSSPDITLKNNIRGQVGKAIKNKNFKTFELLNYTSEDLKLHLELKFKEGMTWDNYGKLWHIDHIKPVASFNFIKKDGTHNIPQIKKCWALKNLQPLWVSENCSKGAKYNKNGKIINFRKSKRKGI